MLSRNTGKPGEQCTRRRGAVDNDAAGWRKAAATCWCDESDIAFMAIKRRDLWRNSFSSNI